MNEWLQTLKGSCFACHSAEQLFMHFPWFLFCRTPSSFKEKDENGKCVCLVFVWLVFVSNCGLVIVGMIVLVMEFLVVEL